MRRNAQPVVGILADDLTGGADAAAPFIADGLSVIVSRVARPVAPDAADVVAFVSSSRDVEVDVALERVKASLAVLLESGPAAVMKKIDSTLRGHLGPELSVVCSVLVPSLVVVAPAFPAHGRQLLEGRLVLDGDFVLEAQQPDAGSPSLPDMLSVSGLAAESLGIESVRSSSLGSTFRDAPIGTVFVCDAADDEDLSSIVRAGSDADRTVLWVGSAGLAAALARHVGVVGPPSASASASASAPIATRDGPLLVVVGSVNARTLTQVDMVVANQGCRVLRVDVDDLVAAPSDVVTMLTGYLAAGHDVVLAPQGEVDPTRAAGVADGLARLVAGAKGSYRGLVLTGGATAEVVLDALRIDAFALRGEVETGVPLGYNESEDLAFITKAGGFGDELLLERCRAALHDELRGTRS